MIEFSEKARGSGPLHFSGITGDRWSVIAIALFADQLGIGVGIREGGALWLGAWVIYRATMGNQLGFGFGFDFGDVGRAMIEHDTRLIGSTARVGNWWRE